MDEKKLVQIAKELEEIGQNDYLIIIENNMLGNDFKSTCIDVSKFESSDKSLESRENYEWKQVDRKEKVVDGIRIVQRLFDQVKKQ